MARIKYWDFESETWKYASASGKGSGFSGADGKSAYELAKEEGFEGTLEEWLESLRGTDGESGIDGKSAYEYALEAGFEGTEEEFSEKMAREYAQVFPLLLSHDADNDIWSADKSFAELLDAYEQGMILMCLIPAELESGIDSALPLSFVESSDDGWKGFYFISSSHSIEETVCVGNDGSVVYSTSQLPKTMPNPNALTLRIGAGAAKKYDGSSEVSVNVVSMKNPQPLVLNDVEYDGSEKVEITMPTKTSELENDSNFVTTDEIPDEYIHPESHPASMITGLADVATSGNYSDLNGTPTIPDKLANPYSLTINGIPYDGSKETEVNISTYVVSVIDYGAVGDGSTDDTVAFQTALAENRAVYVPGGTYKLNGELEVRHHCELRLSIDTVLNFAQTTGNCITLKYLASLKGNHAVIEVPYEFTGNVINLNDYDVSADEYKKDVPPWRHYSPQNKTGRFVTDINIGKVDSYGIHRSVDGWTGGTAVYLTTDEQYDSNSVWAAHFYNIRIAGAFSYGIRAVNIGAGWNHDMRIEATIEACETGISLENCHCAFVDAIIQPAPADDGAGKKTVYAKYGFKLVNSNSIDLSGSRVWDWNGANTLWTSGGEYQHLALIGECRGLILNDFFYYEMNDDIRDLIYTDTPSNLEQMTILQEPFTRWFKPIDNEPYFFNGDVDKRLALKEEIDEYFQTDRVEGFTNDLEKSIDKNGEIYNGIGYADGALQHNTSEIISETESWYIHTGFIKCKHNSVLYVQGIKIGDDGYVRMMLFDSEFNYLDHLNGPNILGNNQEMMTYEETEDGFVMSLNRVGASYIRFNFRKVEFGSNPIISVDNEIKFVQQGFLADDIYIKDQYVDGLSDKYEIIGRKVTVISDDSTDEQYPSAKAVNDAINAKLGVIENGSY